MSGLDPDKRGLKTAVSELMDGAAAAADAAADDQLDLLPLTRMAADRGIAVAGAPRGAGRPAGAKNRSTQEWRKFLLSRHASPLQAMMQTYSLPTDELARLLSCTKAEAFKLQMQCAKECAPYLHQKMPLAIDTGDQGLIQLTINMGQHAAPIDAKTVEGMAVQVLNMVDDESEQNQMFSAEEIENSNGLTSNETGYPDDNADDFGGGND
ncbi:MAG: hypothetical protein Q8K65_12165 [Alphaproteobacteria bacterium]|nr:hypothetical protein [Alphaproteobacteria bacterium]